MPPIVRLLRPHQYAKNLLVFAAPGAAGRLDEASVASRASLAFLLFCLVSSAGYIVNDLIDVEADRAHPTKRFRPLAHRDVTTAHAKSLLGGLALVSLALSSLLGWTFFFVLIGYASASMTYSAAVKRVPWVELLVVSTGFVLRAVAGGAATDTALSGWFVLVVSAGALLVITGKRLGELHSLGSGTPSRTVLARYRVRQLRAATAVAAGLAIGGYAAWAAAEADDQAPDSAGSLLLRLTALPFTVAIARYLMLSWKGAGETPESLIVRDRLMAVAGLGWFVFYATGRYL